MLTSKLIHYFREFTKKTPLFNSQRRAPVAGRLRFELLEDRRLLAAEILYRINAGGGALSGGWSQDSGGGSPYSNASAAQSLATTVSSGINLSHASVPAGTPATLFQTERWDQIAGSEMQWNFPVAPGSYEVRLYFAETYAKAQFVGGRTFDVLIEGQTVLDDYDVYAEVGGYKGVVKTFTVNADNNLDVDFLRGVQNPSVKGIEIIRRHNGNELAASHGSLDFSGTLIGNTISKTVTLSHGGTAGDPSIVIDPQQMQIIGPHAAHFAVQTASSSPVTLAPGETLVVTVRFTAADAALKQATLQIPHTGANATLAISLSGSGVASVPVGFSKSTLQGEISSRPTSLQWGPDNRLYVATQDGFIHIYEVTRNGANDYDVVGVETITSIHAMPNRNDIGTLDSSVVGRLVTGILVTGTATNPVIYICSSDPRIGAGPSGSDLNLDTNSGILSRLTWNGAAWVKLDLVRGLPRSEENHASNGMQLDVATNTLYIAQGGNTNMGAPSNNFAMLPEYALSAAILSVDLDAIGNSTYNIPTLDDESRPGTNDANDPFGGNDGKNQAKLVPGGPVQVYAPGFRNPYDLVLTQSGRLYAIDNGPNGGWGGAPVNEGPAGLATNERSEPGNTFGDGLHFISGPGFYGGHPNPTRSNPANTFNPSNPQSPVTVGNPVESDYITPGQENGSLFTWGFSTNGLTEYRASNFQSSLKGDLLAASFDNSIRRVKLNAAGNDIVSEQKLFSSVGITPLDVTAVGDDGLFPGTIWVADVANGNLYVFEPSDFGGGVGGPPGNPNDLDGDGYTNDDEAANGTNPQSAADTPADFDRDFVSNLTDADDDNDSLLDHADPFAIDANNGLTTFAGVSYTWENDAPAAGGLLNMGFTGLMTNSVDNYASLYDATKLTAGGAAGVLTLDEIGEGDASGALNSQQQAFQFGVNLNNVAGPVVAHTRLLAPFSGETPSGQQSMGFFIGTGDQSNYLKLVVAANNGVPGVQMQLEVGNTITTSAFSPLTLTGLDAIDLFLTIDRAASTVQASYQIGSGQRITIGGPVAVPTSWLSGGKALAVGIISTSIGPAPPIAATWDFLQVVPATSPPPTGPPPTNNVLYRINAGGGALAGGWQNDASASPSAYSNASAAQSTTTTVSSAINLTHLSVPAGTPASLFQTERWDQTSGSEMQWNFPVTPGQYEVRLYFAETYSKAQKVGGRIFDVLIEGQTVLDNYDAYAEVGGYKGVVKSFTVSADSNLDIDFARVVQNPSVKGIEIVQLTAGPGTLAANTSSLDFANVLIGQSETLQVLLTNTGGPGANAIEIVPSSATIAGAGSDQYELNFASAGSIILAAGQSTSVGVTFRPTRVGSAPATLTIPHSGNNSALVVALSGAGQQAPVTSGAATIEVDSGGTMSGSSTYSSGSFKISNNSLSGQKIASVRVDISSALLPDVVFDPNGTAGDPVGKGFTADSGASQTGLQGHVYGSPLHTGFQALDVAFTDFNPGEQFTFSIDIDPTTIRGANDPGPEAAGSVSGFELMGSMVTIAFSDGSQVTTELFRKPNSSTGGVSAVKPGGPAAVALQVLGIPSIPATVGVANQLVRITGSAGATGQLLRIESALHLNGVPNGGYDVDPYEANKAISVTQQAFTIGSGGFVDVPVTLTKSHAEGGINQIIAVLSGSDGQNGPLAKAVLKYEPAPPPPTSNVVYRINAGGGALSGGWTSDSGGGSPYSNASAAQSVATTVSSAINLSHASVPTGTPAALFQSERWDQIAGSEMQWNFPVAPGSYEVRLYFAETYANAQKVGGRVFDVLIEGQTVLDNYDVYAEVGGYKGVVKTFTVNADNNLDVDFLRGVQNPSVKGIEIIRL